MYILTVLGTRTLAPKSSALSPHPMAGILENSRDWCIFPLCCLVTEIASATTAGQRICTTPTTTSWNRAMRVYKTTTCAHLTTSTRFETCCSFPRELFSCMQGVTTGSCAMRPPSVSLGRIRPTRVCFRCASPTHGNCASTNADQVRPRLVQLVFV